MAAVNVFSAASTQWSVSQAGLLGLRYEALPVLLECGGVPREQWPEVLAGVRIMEAHALKLIAERRG